jgi:hypothetical protein
MKGLELEVRGGDGRIERAPLVVRIGGSLFENGILMAQLEYLPDGHAWRRCHTAERTVVPR